MPVQRRKRRSSVWGYFVSKEDSPAAECIECKREIKTPGGSTSGLLRHLASVHGICINGTVAVTGVPSNDCELQLFRVLQRANLLSYFDMMIELGGDDVQQLCDAGEEEFLEIMALIGMASKPLHVRRLQKALQEWMTQPSLFQAPVLPPGEGCNGTDSSLKALPQLVVATGQGSVSNLPYQAISDTGPTNAIPVVFPGVSAVTALPGMSDPKGSPAMLNAGNHIHSTGMNNVAAINDNLSITGNPFPAVSFQQQVNALNPQLASLLESLSPNLINNQQQHQSRNLHSSNYSTSSNKHRNSTRGKDKSCSGGATLPVTISDIKIPVDQLIPSHFLETRIRTNSELSSPASSIAGSPHPDGRSSVSPVPLFLLEHEVQKLADAAIHLIRSLPPTVAEPKLSTKRKTSADYELILRLSESDPKKLEDEVRRVAAVYGRPDAKRKSLKPLSMHELAINEAAAQLCKHIPALLTKREELLSLSRQVLRESGLPYAAVSSTFSIPVLANGFVNTAAVSSSIINNNDINTKSKYEDINRSHSQKNRDILEGANSFHGFHSKRFRLDGASGIEIQEYNHSRPSSVQGSPSSSSSNVNNGMQITELRCLPPRRSPSDDNLRVPLELVTVTSSDHRKNGISAGTTGTSKPASSISSISPPIRRPFSVDSDDLNNSNSSNFHHLHGLRFGHHQELINAPHSVKIASIPVSGGSISILNHSVNSSSNHFIGQHLHNHQYNGSTHSGMKFIPIKSEPTVN